MFLIKGRLFLRTSILASRLARSSFEDIDNETTKGVLEYDSVFEIFVFLGLVTVTTTLKKQQEKAGK